MVCFFYPYEEFLVLNTGQLSVRFSDDVAIYNLIVWPPEYWTNFMFSFQVAYLNLASVKRMLAFEHRTAVRFSNGVVSVS